ncbi:hypothetical protein HPB52_019598 [Rhipicephalus sanguineus]|uniref:Uncharacterized protein n=1 Tax=Rhipicephalus sanguineus TaxID=34632 RepID=A0A9D4PP77_RHISA|nr:hypothetical protein HPB52_019598 [Rhipicephalus sanguineus]
MVLRNPGLPLERRLHVTAMANSEQLRKKRGALRAGVTRALTLLTDLLQQPDPDASQISGHMDYLKDKETALLEQLNPGLATSDLRTPATKQARGGSTVSVQWKRVRRQARMSTLILDARVVVIGGRIGVTPHLRNLSQIGYFLCEHHDEDRILEILHTEYILIKHVKNALHAIRVGPKDGKGCDSRRSMTAVNRHYRKQSERRAGVRALSADFERPLKSVSTAQHR